MRVVFVHGACVKDGSWWWHRTAELLAERGIASEAPALPSCGEMGESPSAGGPRLADDVAAVRQVLTASDEPTVVVAHSYGGIVTAEAAAGVGSVRHLLLVSSYLPEVGQSLSSFGAQEPAPFLDVDVEGGTFTVRTSALADIFLQDCDAEIQHEAIDRTARQSLAVLDQPVNRGPITIGVVGAGGGVAGPPPVPAGSVAHPVGLTIVSLIKVTAPPAPVGRLERDVIAECHRRRRRLARGIPDEGLQRPRTFAAVGLPKRIDGGLKHA